MPERLAIMVADDEAMPLAWGRILDGPRRRAAMIHRPFRLRPQSSSASRLTAGAIGFLILSQ